MATRYYGANIGAMTHSDVLEQSSTTSRTVEVQVVYDATGANKFAVIAALEAIEQLIVKDTWPPV